jgi:quercetin dioxygenase-like cupin family protein
MPIITPFFARRVILVAVAACAPASPSRPATVADSRTSGRPSILAAEEGEARLLRGRKPVILKVDPQTVGSKHLFAGTEAVPPGDSLGRHQHLEEEEILFLDHGVLEVTLAGQTTRAEAGGLVFIPPGTHVSARNPGPDISSSSMNLPSRSVSERSPRQQASRTWNPPPIRPTPCG